MIELMAIDGSTKIRLRVAINTSHVSAVVEDSVETNQCLLFIGHEHWRVTVSYNEALDMIRASKEEDQMDFRANMESIIKSVEK